MTLKSRLCTISLICTIITLSVCLCVHCALQSERTLANAEAQTRNSLKLFCTNLESIDRTAQSADFLTARSIAQYYFASYAHILGGGAYYSLVLDGEYLFNSCPYDPNTLLKLPDNATEAYNTFQIDGYRIVVARRVRMLTEDYTAYLCADVSEAYAQVDEIIRISAILLALSALAVILLVSLFVKRALAPMDRLKQTAEAIAGGAYSLRAAVESNDEVAALANAFNHMAAAVESRINELTEESERRKLLLGALAHELKTPMTAIIGFSDSQIKMPLTDEQKTHCAEQILLAGRRTERISQKLMLLLSLDSENALNKQSFSAAEFASELSQAYNERVQISICADTLFGDRDLLMTLLQNLINNALHASAQSEKIDVMLAENKLVVSDRGCGIPSEHIARLTEPFYRVDKARSRKHGGAGLGLSLCRAIVAAHGGTIQIESSVGVGTTVTVVLPEDKQ